MSIVLARLSYDGGVNPITLLTIRITFFLAALLLFLRLAGKPIRLQPRERYASLFLGAIVAMGSFGSYSSIEYIPVSLMVLILYTYPILVAVAMRFTAGERMTPIKVIALLTAFLGLALALQVAVQQKAPIGFAFAAMGAIGLTLTVLVSNRILRRTDSRRMTVHMSMTTTALYATALIATDSLSLPQTDIGWYALCIIPPLWVAAILTFFTGLPMIGPTRAATLGNMEPVLTILFAVLLLGEFLSNIQLLGAALVIGAVFLMQFYGWSASRKA